MNDKFYSNKEFTDLKKRLNKEILRRAGFRWMDPLATPKVGEDRRPPLSLPDSDPVRIPVDDRTYTINNPSEGSIEPTKNIHFPSHGENPGGCEPEFVSNKPDNSAALVTVGEMKNFLVGLSKINDISLFYGRDEEAGMVFRDPNGISELLTKAESDKLHETISVEDNPNYTKNDPNGGYKNIKNPDYPVENHPVSFREENGVYVMPSGEYDGEELGDGLSEKYFFDDYGAPEGNGDFHPYNPGSTPRVHRDINVQNDKREIEVTPNIEGGTKSSTFGQNPRNPQMGDEYKSRPIYRGVPGTCNNSCTGLCYISCDDLCSESCTSTCFSRCGNACSGSCQNSCTGCSSQCYQTCKTKCENSNGYACVKSGAKAVRMENGQMVVETYSCSGCSYSCQFYPNKKTTCWDAGCMGKCFTSCESSCMDSCVGGCTANDKEEGDYKSGKGKGCSSSCTMNCIGDCEGVCEGQCIGTCFTSCRQSCSDTCEFECSTECGFACASSCKNACKGCQITCVSGCKANTESTTCTGCSSKGGCDSNCQNDCTSTCFDKGCKSQCGTRTGGACSSSCRMNCQGTSCTSKCSDACSSECTSCVNRCDLQCGACSGNCSADCESLCKTNCMGKCKLSCSSNCVKSCTEECGACSGLCFSCVGMCIAQCAFKCENGCSSCANNCGYWCDSTCNQECFSNCNTLCLNSCNQSCSTKATGSNPNTTDSTNPFYKISHFKNRADEIEGFMLWYRDQSGQDGTVVELDENSFFIKGSDIFIRVNNWEVVHLVIENDHMVLYNDGGDFDNEIAAKFRFNISEDGRLKLIMEE